MSILARMRNFPFFPQLDLLRLSRWVLPVGMGVALAGLVLTGRWYYAAGAALALPLGIGLLRRPFLGVILWLLIIPWVPVLPAASLMYWFFQRILPIVVLAMAALIHLAQRGPGTRLHWRPADAACLLAVGLGLVRIVFFQSGATQQLIRYGDNFLAPLAIYLTVRLLPPDRTDRKLLVWAAFAIGLSQSSIGVVSILAPGLLPGALQAHIPGYAGGTLQNPNAFAFALIFCGLVLFDAALHSRSHRQKLLFWGVCVLCLVGVFLSMERAAWLGGVLAVGGLLLARPRLIIRLAPVGVLLAAALWVGGLADMADQASNRLNDAGTVYGRIVVTDAMLQMINEKPLFGWGFETLNQHIANYYRVIGRGYIAMGVTTSHNTLLTIATELGLIVAAFYIFPLAWLGGRWWQARRSRGRERQGLWRGMGLDAVEEGEQRQWVAALWLAALAYLAIGMFMDFRWFPYAIGLWWFIIGLIANEVAPLAIPAGEREARR